MPRCHARLRPACGCPEVASHVSLRTPKGEASAGVLLSPCMLPGGRQRARTLCWRARPSFRPWRAMLGIEARCRIVPVHNGVPSVSLASFPVLGDANPSFVLVESLLGWNLRCTSGHCIIQRIACGIPCTMWVPLCAPCGWPPVHAHLFLRPVIPPPVCITTRSGSHCSYSGRPSASWRLLRSRRLPAALTSAHRRKAVWVHGFRTIRHRNVPSPAQTAGRKSLHGVAKRLPCRGSGAWFALRKAVRQAEMDIYLCTSLHGYTGAEVYGRTTAFLCLCVYGAVMYRWRKENKTPVLRTGVELWAM